MFERYNEHARRIIFFARYEASQYGSPAIETEHVLLGLIREDKTLTHRFVLKKVGSAEEIRRKIDAASPKREKVSTSVDLPMSHECRRVLAHAAEESVRLDDRYIGSEHLMLGLLREEKSFAAQLLQECGVRLESVRAALATSGEAKKTKEAAAEKADPGQDLGGTRNDLTELAGKGKLNAFVARDAEMERLIQVLGRSTKNNAVLIGETGVGKRAMVEGLAKRVVDHEVPSFLTGKRILDFDSTQMVGPRRAEVTEILLRGKPILFFIEDLFSFLASAPLVSVPPAAETIKGLFLDNKIQCICSATNDDYRLASATHRWLDGCFSAIEIPSMSEADTAKVLLSAKERLEKFHSVIFDQTVLEDAVRYSAAFIHDRPMPDKALDLIDEAAVHAKSRHESNAPEELREIRKQLRLASHALESAVASHDFTKAKPFSDVERKLREQLQQLEQKYKVNEPVLVMRQDIEEVLAQITGIPVNEIRKGPPGRMQ